MTHHQEKCVCENPRVCHQEECGEIGKHCTVCLKPIAAPSPHTEGVEKRFYEDLADNEWIIDDPYSPDVVHMPFYELEKRIKAILHQTREEGRREERKYIFSLANKIRLLPENLKEQIESYEKFLKEQRQRLKGGGK